MRTRWTCGECGDSYEAEGYMAHLDVKRWERDHKEDHRVAKLPEDERKAYYAARAQASLRALAEGLPS